jgi:Zn-dependent peptidase ImmA (M78 family)/transcriptional regulator with XRE-family HTH domain
MTTKIESVPVSPHLLVWARESLGLSIEAAATRLDVKPENLRGWESGNEPVAFSTVQEFAHVYHRPLAVFLLERPPLLDPLPKDFRSLGQGTRRDSFSPQTLLAIRRAKRSRRAAIDAAKALGTETHPSLPSHPHIESPESTAQEFATSIRAYGEGEPPHFPDEYSALRGWRELIEGTNTLVFQQPMPADDVRGFSLPEEAFPAIVLNQKDSPRARIFTLFHEVCHLILRNGGICDLGEPRGANSGSIESVCNRFSGAFLVPKKSFELSVAKWGVDEEGIRKLTHRYQVSEEVILRRLLTFDLIDRAAYADQVSLVRARIHAFLKRGPKEAGFADPARVKLNELGVRTTSLLVEAHRAGHLSLSELATNLGVRLKQIPRIDSFLGSGSSSRR